MTTIDPKYLRQRRLSDSKRIGLMLGGTAAEQRVSNRRNDPYDMGLQSVLWSQPTAGMADKLEAYADGYARKSQELAEEVEVLRELAKRVRREAGRTPKPKESATA